MVMLSQFLFRLSFGLAAAMAVTSPRQVTSGYFRVHLYVILGLNVLAALVAAGSAGTLSPWPPGTAVLLSYAGSVAWLYEKPLGGRVLLALVSLTSIGAAWLAAPAARGSPIGQILAWLDPVTGGLVLGVTLAAMLLGHWYLNTPTMQLAPLVRLVRWMAAAVGLRAGVCALGAVLEVSSAGMPDTSRLLFLALRWLSGLVGALLLAWMTGRTLRIPNTQSATGILYVGVIVTFVGELTSLLLSRGSAYPL